MINTPIKPRDWIQLPSKRVVCVRRVLGDQVGVRFVDANGALGTGEFDLTLEFLKFYGTKVATHG